MEAPFRVMFTVLHDDDSGDDDDWDLGKPTSGFHLERRLRDKQAMNQEKREEGREGEYVLGCHGSALVFCLK